MALPTAPRLPPETCRVGDKLVRDWGHVDCALTYDAMRAWTAVRDEGTADEIWLAEHAPVFTQGIAGQAAHLLDPRNVPVLQTDRGGQVTFHGPGQVVAYPLIDLRRLGIYVKEYVYRLETAAIQTLEAFGVSGFRVAGAPGLYVSLTDPQNSGLPAGPRQDRFAGLGKIVALGIKVSRHCTYHGLALNVHMDLRPYDQINPCGYAGLKTVDMATLGVAVEPESVAAVLVERLAAHLSP